MGLQSHGAVDVLLQSQCACAIRHAVTNLKPLCPFIELLGCKRKVKGRSNVASNIRRCKTHISKFQGSVALYVAEALAHFGC
jgi:hypothetical protein